jgi:hypothetical protein
MLRDFLDRDSLVRRLLEHLCNQVGDQQPRLGQGVRPRQQI